MTRKLPPETGDVAPPSGDDGPRAIGITRRDFLAVAGAALSASVLPASLTACGPASPGGLEGLPGPKANFTATLIRPTDLLSITIGFVNLALSMDKTTLQPISPSDPAYLQVDFGPQHLLEKVFFEGADAPPSAGTAIQSLLAGNTRVVFVVPAGQSLEYSVSSLLKAFGTLDMNVSGIATPNVGVLVPKALPISPIARARQQRFAGTISGGSQRLLNAPTIPIPLGGPYPSALTSVDTALELPTRLMLAPNQHAGWAHALSEVTSPTSKRTELWHTRLGVRVAGAVDESDAHADVRTVRAIWTRDLGFDPLAHPSTGPWKNPTDWAALRSADRADIVFESASPWPGTSQPRTPQAMQVNRLMLTSLGGWLDVRGDFGEQPYSGLAEWQQRTTMGRDHYVKIVHTGILYPFGHRAVMIRITERKLNGGTAEALWGTVYIVVRQPVVAYDAGSDATLQKALRQFPFKQITITTLSTPALDASQLVKTKDPQPPVQPKLADGSMQFYAFKMVGIDHAGHEVHFESPALWVATRPGNTPATATQLDTSMTQGDLDTLFGQMSPTSAVNGQRVAFAPEAPMAMGSMMASKKPGGSTYETHSFTHKGVQATANWPRFPSTGLPFLPNITSASVAIEALRGLAPGASDAVDVIYHQAFLDNGFGSDTGPSAPNAGDLLFQLASSPNPTDFKPAAVDFSAHSDSAGGFVNPNLAVTALSRALGPVSGDLDLVTHQAAPDVGSGTFDPDKFFATLGMLTKNAKIFGVFALNDIISVQKFGKKLGLDQAPKFLTQALNDVEALVADAQQIISLLSNIQTIANGLDSTIKAQVTAELGVLQQTATNLANEATTLATAIGDAVTHVTSSDATLTPTDIQTAVTSLAKLPALLGQVPTAIDGFGSKLPVKLTNVTSQLRTLADTLNQAVAGLGSNFQTLMQAYVTGQDLVKNLAIKVDWTTPVVGFPGTDPGKYIFDPVGGLLLSAELRLKATQGKPAGLDLLCGLEKFNVHLFGGQYTFITIHFLRLQFVVKAGKKASVDVALDKPGIEFQGPLSFVQTLTSIIPLDGFSDPPGISVSASGIVASFSIGLPTLAVGVFSLSNMSIGAGFTIPFIGDPVSVTFDFCTRENPFILTVTFLGGGGFFGIQLNPNGIESLEASFEAGAGIAVDFGVASGSVSAMIGIYFKMEFDSMTGSDNATLIGFFRLRGEVDVLGIITASIELYLELKYESSSKKVTGTATLDIDVSVFFFHATVSLTATKRFSGGNNDPTFLDVMQPANANDVARGDPYQKVTLGYAPWTQYLNAFAA